VAPVTVPETTVATDVLLLAHVPPDTASVKVVACPLHTLEEPDNADGGVVTVTTE